MKAANISKGDFFLPGGKTGCLLVHGFSGNPASLRLMGEDLSRRGITVYAPLLKGHGTSTADMAFCTCHDWLASAEAGLQKLLHSCSRVFVAGLSMGGTISLYLAHRYPDEVKGVIPVCSPVLFKDWRLYFLPLLRPFLGTVPGVGGDIKDSSVPEQGAYDRVPVTAVQELLKLSRLIKPKLPAIKQPALVIAAREDHVIHADNPMYILQSLGSKDKELVWLENSYHVATLDYDKQIVFDRTADFIEKNS